MEIVLLIFVSWLASGIAGFWLDRHPIHGRHIL